MIATVDALRALSPEHRQALADTWLHGRDVADAAGATGDSAADLTRRLHEALRALASSGFGRRDWPAGVHVGVGAFLLRLLDAESERCFAEHLSSCAACRDEVVGLGPVVTALDRARGDRDGAAGRRAARAMAPGARVTPPVGFPRPASAPATGATRHAARSEREAARASGPRLLLPLAATAVLLTAGGVASADDLGLAPAPVVVPQAGASGRGPAASSASSAGDVRRAAANGPGTGVAAEVEVSAAAPDVQGVRVSLSLTGLDGPRSCRLVAVWQDGATQVLATWQVPPAGFGTKRQPDPFALSVVTAAEVGDLVTFRVESGDAAVGRVLVTVRM